MHPTAPPRLTRGLYLAVVVMADCLTDSPDTDAEAREKRSLLGRGGGHNGVPSSYPAPSGGGRGGSGGRNGSYLASSSGGGGFGIGGISGLYSTNPEEVVVDLEVE